MSIRDMCLKGKAGAAIAALAVSLCAAIGITAARTASRPPVRLIKAAETPPLFIGVVSTGRYYVPWCPGLAKADPANLADLHGQAAAEAAGYSAAKGCVGIPAAKKH